MPSLLRVLLKLQVAPRNDQGLMCTDTYRCRYAQGPNLLTPRMLETCTRMCLAHPTKSPRPGTLKLRAVCLLFGLGCGLLQAETLPAPFLLSLGEWPPIVLFVVFLARLRGLHSRGTPCTRLVLPSLLQCLSLLYLNSTQGFHVWSECGILTPPPPSLPLNAGACNGFHLEDLDPSLALGFYL